MYKYLLFLIMSFGIGFIYADCTSCDPCNQPDCSVCCDNSCNSCCCMPCCCEPCDFCPPEPPEICAYNAPKYLDLKCSWDMFVTGSFVYMQAKEENLNFIETVTEVEDPNTQFSSLTGDFSTLSFDYKPAFKVGLGFNFGCDNWDFYAEYFRYHANVGSGNFSKSVNDENTFMTVSPYLNPCNVFDDGVVTIFPCNSIEASTSWRLEMDMVDFLLRRKYFVGKCLVVQAAAGIRAGWIDQRQKTNYVCMNTVEVEPEVEITTLTFNVDNNSESWAVGAKAAVDTEWNFCGSFRFFGNTSFAILYTDYNKINSDGFCTLENSLNPDNQDQTTYTSSRSLCFLRPDASVTLGLGWGDYWCCNDWYFDLSAGYEFHVYWNQNVFPQLNDFSQDPTALRGDLYMHGLVITARLDF